MARYINRAARGQAVDDRLIEKILNQAREIYGSDFRELESDQFTMLQMISRSDPVIFIHMLRQLFEGDKDGIEEANIED